MGNKDILYRGFQHVRCSHCFIVTRPGFQERFCDLSNVFVAILLVMRDVDAFLKQLLMAKLCPKVLCLELKLALRQREKNCIIVKAS